MIRTIVILLYIILFLLTSLLDFVRVKWVVYRKQIKKLDQIMYKKARTWARIIFTLSGSSVTVIGEEHVPKDEAVLFVSNHQGMFDIVLLLGYIKKPKAFIAKKELQKIPIMGAWMEYLKCIFMDRKDIRQSLRSINQGVEYLKQGYSMIIFPEGTRSKTGELLDFKPGGMKLATKSGVAVIPVTIKGSNKILGNNGLKIYPAHVEMVISPPVRMEELGLKDANELNEYVKNIIDQNL